MDGYSQMPYIERVKMLHSLIPEVFDEGNIDWEKLKATLGEFINFSNERYVLNWAGKSDAFRVMQRPTSATLIPCREESVDFDNTQNIFIEGENMEVLKVLQKSYFGKVKMIYIDPPYNTGNDSFVYPDKFSESKEEYMRRVGDKNEEGYMVRDAMFRKNSKENGQYHSNWLNMMMPRLYLAKSLLREDGVIFVSIDDNEVHNLRLLMNEIFGEENFICEFIWQKRKGGGNDSTYVAIDHEYILAYVKNHNEGEHWRIAYDEEYLSRYKYEDAIGRYYFDTLSRNGLQSPIIYDVECPDGTIIKNGTWQVSKKTFEEGLKSGDIAFIKNKQGNFSVVRKVRMPAGRVMRSIINDVTNKNAADEMGSLFNNTKFFSNPKPTGLLEKILQLNPYNSNEECIILDFFAGSCTTAHAVMQLNKKDDGNRKYICVQLPEKCDEKSEAYKAGYKTIADIAKERIRRAGAKIHAEVEAERTKQQEQLQFDDEETVHMPDLGFKVFKLTDSNFKQWKEIKTSEKEKWQEQTLEFIDPVAETATIDNMVYELLLKYGKNLNSSIIHKDGCFAINDRELYLMLETATQDVLDAIIAEKPKKVIALDRLFMGNDQLKTNAVLQMRDAGVEFKTI